MPLVFLFGWGWVSVRGWFRVRFWVRVMVSVTSRIGVIVWACVRFSNGVRVEIRVRILVGLG